MRDFALELLTCPDPRGQAVRAVETLAACSGDEVTLLAPQGPASWLVLASSDPRQRDDLLLGGERRPELEAVRREALPVIPEIPPQETEAGVLRRTSAVLPVFRDPGSGDPSVLLVESPRAPSLGRLSLAVLIAHLLLHRLATVDGAGVATRLGLRPTAAAAGPDWLDLLPLPAVVVDRDGHVDIANSAATWLLQRGGTPPSRDPGPLAIQPPRPWLGPAGHWDASLQVSGKRVEVRGWSSPGACETFLVLLERTAGEEPGSPGGQLRSSLQAKILELEAANRRLEELARLRTRFVSDAAHELKTPLAIVRSYLDALGTDLAAGLGPHQREFVAAATEGARRLQRLVEELLDLAALESGNLPVEVGPVDAPTCLRDVFQELAPLARLAGVEVFLGPLTAVTVRADPARLAQVLRNLVDNAVKYTPAGGLVRMSCRRRGESGVIEVSDNGVGIPAQELPRIFEEFHRVRRMPLIEGAGLGLAIVRRLVQTLGGRIEVVSEPGAGSRFAVELPLWTDEP